ncbi:MAG: hypothetical protein AAF327_14030 [Cyanobacteria bacterium P01_A01_bin.37]
MEETSLIDCIKIALQSEIPNPKYQQFQWVKQGQIVGVCWYSLEHCWGEGMHPGWWYTVEKNFDHHIIHESSIQPLESANED